MVASHIHPKQVEAGGSFFITHLNTLLSLPPALFSLVNNFQANSSRDCGDGFSLFFSPPALYSIKFTGGE